MPFLLFNNRFKLLQNCCYVSMFSIFEVFLIFGFSRQPIQATHKSLGETWKLQLRITNRLQTRYKHTTNRLRTSGKLRASHKGITRKLQVRRQVASASLLLHERLIRNDCFLFLEKTLRVYSFSIYQCLCLCFFTVIF